MYKSFRMEEAYVGNFQLITISIVCQYFKTTHQTTILFFDSKFGKYSINLWKKMLRNGKLGR